MEKEWCYGTYVQARSDVDARKRKGTGCNGARGMRTKYWCRVVRAGEVGSVRARCVVNVYGEFVMLCWGFGERVRERVGCVPWQMVFGCWPHGRGMVIGY